jgi:2-iminoacetate synthase ThiH
MLRLFVTSMETALMAIEAGNVISLRLQMLSRGDLAAAREAELMVSEKIAAFTKAGADVMSGVSAEVIRNNLRSAIRANAVRLSGLRHAA